MKKLDLYLIKKFAGPFVAVFFVVVFTLSMQFLWAYMGELIGKGLGVGVIMEFMGWASCTLFPNAIPLATLLASIMTMGGLGERNELLAMKAAGVSLTRILMPLMMVSTPAGRGSPRGWSPRRHPTPVQIHPGTRHPALRPAAYRAPRRDSWADRR